MRRGRLQQLRQLERRDPELGAWRMWARPADPRLTSWGGRITGYQQHDPTPSRHVTTASALLPIVIPLDHRHRVQRADGRTIDVGAFVAGSHEAVGQVEATGFTGIQLDLDPAAARRILGTDVAALAGDVVAFDAVFGHAGQRLVERVGNTEDWSVRLRLVERFMIDRLGDGPADDVPTAVWRLLAHGETSVDDLAIELAYSTRHLRRLVRDAFGLTPKRLARLARFYRTLLWLERDRTSEIGAIAVEHGYADQSHLARDVRAMAGTSPTLLRAQRAPVDVADSSSRPPR